MRRSCGRVTFSPSDLNDFVECEHLTRLELAVARRELARPAADNPHAELIRRKGEEHERAHLEALRAAGREVVEIERGEGAAAIEAATRATQEAMRAGAEVVYQAVLLDEGWLGYADFLERVERPSALGPWSYEVADTKLARTSKPTHLLQLAFYSEQVGRIQGLLPEGMHVVLGTNERASFRVRDFDAYARRLRRRFLAWIEEPPATYPHPVEHCPVCDWREVCAQKRVDDDHLCLVAGMWRRWSEQLNGIGIATVAQLAAAPPDAETPLSPRVFARLREQAELQARERATGRHEYRLLPPQEGRGLALLPRPSEGDVFFDVEGDPFFAAGHGLEYLFGLAWLEDGGPRYRAFWAHDRAAEKRAFEELVDFLSERLARHPDAHVYHYAAYEPTTLKRLMGEHGTREDAVDELLRREAFVDLYRVVEQALRISRPGYGLKEVERFYLPPREEELVAGGDSILVFEQWRESGDGALLEAIERYNEADCRSTLRLRDWLLERREEAGVAEWREAPERREVPEEVAEALAERERLKATLLEGAEEGDLRWLAAHLLDYHRREDKPAWWEWFRRRELTPEELVWDTEAIGELAPTEIEPEQDKRSLVFTLAFPPQQHKLAPGQAVDPETERAEQIVEIDDGQGLLRLRRGPKWQDAPLPRALVPGRPYDTRYQRDALRRLAEEIASGGSRYRALQDVLARERPRVRMPAGPFDLEEAKRVVSELDESHLFVQGPPGSGKTWAGARLIVHLLRQGKRVGIAAPSHKAIHNLLAEVEQVARKEGFSFRGLKKCTAGEEETVYEGDFVASSDEIADFAEPQLVAGTAWLFAREEMDGTLDRVFVDEAGQVALADALAIGTAARNLVLLGDPLQLAQVSQGVHPGGSGRSVLEHLLADDATIPPERGLFLDRTFRMHPAVCGFISEIVYEGRLQSAPGCERQELEGVGAGLRYLPVEHEGRSQASLEEAERIGAEIERLRGRRYTDRDGRSRPLRDEDIVVVAPYNAQVRCLRSRLPEAVRVGTVDKFQGQEAPVVFYSTASSSGEDIPRGLEFLFSRNRLNVAISRAQCLAVLVGSPRLLDVRCRTVEQMRMVNALCRLVETAERAEA